MGKDAMPRMQCPRDKKKLRRDPKTVAESYHQTYSTVYEERLRESSCLVQ